MKSSHFSSSNSKPSPYAFLNQQNFDPSTLNMEQLRRDMTIIEGEFSKLKQPTLSEITDFMAIMKNVFMVCQRHEFYMKLGNEIEASQAAFFRENNDELTSLGNKIKLIASCVNRYNLNRFPEVMKPPSTTKLAAEHSLHEPKQVKPATQKTKKNASEGGISFAKKGFLTMDKVKTDGKKVAVKKDDLVESLGATKVAKDRERNNFRF